MNISVLIGTGISVFLFIVAAWIMLALRRVVPTNEVHIVQSRKATRSFGKDTTNGNVYYEWPTWMPAVGVGRPCAERGRPEADRQILPEKKA